MVLTSPAFMPVMMKGIQIHPDNPLLFDFILDTGKSGLRIDSKEFKAEAQKLIKYFLASLTIKEDDVWVNLSPYEKDKMIPQELGKTELGRDMLAQDYILKQLTASLIYPEKELGKKFWDSVYTKAQQQFGSTDIPIDTFNKVWIVADKAKVLERNNAAYVVGSHLKVMLEEDYVALGKQTAINQRGFAKNKTHTIASQIVREIVIPEIEKEVNQGQNFAPLRQMFYSIILSSWYKIALKDALLNQVYTNKGKTAGVLADDQSAKEKIYQQYLQAYKKGVFNYIKEDIDAVSREAMPRKYFSGGIHEGEASTPAIARKFSIGDDPVQQGDDLAMASVQMAGRPDAAMMVKNKEEITQEVRAIDTMLDFLSGVDLQLFRDVPGLGVINRIRSIPPELPFVELDSKQAEERNEQLGILVSYRDVLSGKYKREDDRNFSIIRSLVGELAEEFKDLSYGESSDENKEVIYLQFTDSKKKEYEERGEELEPAYETLQRRLIDKLLAKRSNLVSYARDRFGLTVGKEKRKAFIPPRGLSATRYVSTTSEDVKWLEGQINSELQERGKEGSVHLAFASNQKGFRVPAQGLSTFILGDQLNVLDFMEYIEDFILRESFSEARSKEVLGRFSDRYNKAPNVFQAPQVVANRLKVAVEDFLKSLKFSKAGEAYNLSKVDLDYYGSGWHGLQTAADRKMTLSLSMHDHYGQSLVESVENAFSGILKEFQTNFQEPAIQKKWQHIKRMAVAVDTVKAKRQLRTDSSAAMTTAAIDRQFVDALNRLTGGGWTLTRTSKGDEITIQGKAIVAGEKTIYYKILDRVTHVLSSTIYTSEIQWGRVMQRSAWKELEGIVQGGDAAMSVLKISEKMKTQFQEMLTALERGKYDRDTNHIGIYVTGTPEELSAILEKLKEESDLGWDAGLNIGYAQQGGRVLISGLFSKGLFNLEKKESKLKEWLRNQIDRAMSVVLNEDQMNLVKQVATLYNPKAATIDDSTQGISDNLSLNLGQAFKFSLLKATEIPNFNDYVFIGANAETKTIFEITPEELELDRLKALGLQFGGVGGQLMNQYYVLYGAQYPIIMIPRYETRPVATPKAAENSSEVRSDRAALANLPAKQPWAQGGIDLNAKNMGLDVTRQGNGVNMNFDPAMAAEFQKGNFAGVEGIILRIVPIQNPLPMLGLETSPAEGTVAKG